MEQLRVKLESSQNAADDGSASLLQENKVGRGDAADACGCLHEYLLGASLLQRIIWLASKALGLLPRDGCTPHPTSHKRVKRVDVLC